MISPSGSTPTRPQSAARRRPRAAGSRPPSALTPAAPTRARSAASTPGSTGASSTTWPSRRTSPSCTTADAPPRAPRWRSPRRASVRSSPGSRFQPASRRPGCWPGTGGPPPIAGEDRRDRSGSRTWRPCSPPVTGRGGVGGGIESDQVALERGRLDAVIAGLLFMAGMRRSEVSALRWADVVDSTDGDGMLVTVRRSKGTDQIRAEIHSKGSA